MVLLDLIVGLILPVTRKEKKKKKSKAEKQERFYVTDVLMFSMFPTNTMFIISELSSICFIQCISTIHHIKAYIVFHLYIIKQTLTLAHDIQIATGCKEASKHHIFFSSLETNILPCYLYFIPFRL